MQSEVRSRPRNVTTAVIDVCLYNLVKCVKCDVPCSEGYGPSNLVTNNFIEKSKGFLAERFIKPPVNLTLEFKSEIDIEYVAVTCSVGAQKSKGLELFSQSISKGCYYESVASGVLPDDKIGFVFHRFNVNVKDKFGEKYSFRTFKSSRFLSLVNNIKIKIFCTSGVSIPALGKIEIWGTPLKSVPLRQDGNTSLQTPTSFKRPEELVLTAISCKSYEPKTTKPSHLLSVIKRAELNESFTIPDDFIDPISCEVMIQPIILPSGKVIDSSTLKSHEKAELRWGRGPSDPFTGIPFSDSNKPIAASDLKSRIDKFLSDNSNVSELKNMPRTLGTKASFHMPRKQSCEVVVSKLVTKTNFKSEARNQPTDCSSSNTGLNELKPTTSKRKYAQIDLDTHSTFEFAVGSKNNMTRPLTYPSPSSSVNHTDVGLCEKLSVGKKSQDTFQERMELSLELALKSTLSKLPKLTCDKSDSIECEVVTALCNRPTCKSLENLFSIPCNHFVCRSCLLQVKRDNIPAVCLLCNCKYNSSDVQKVHTR